MDCRGLGPLAQRLDQLAASVCGRARVVMLDAAAPEGGQVRWTLSLTDLAGAPLAHQHLRLPDADDAPLAARRHLRLGGLTVDGEWIASPDVVRPRYYARVLVTSGLN